MRVPVLVALAVASPAAAQFNWNAQFSACDPADLQICADVQLFARGTSLRVFATPTELSESITWLSLSVPSVFISQLSSYVPYSLGSWWFTLSGSTASYGNPTPYLSGSDDAFGILPTGGVFRFRLQSPIDIASADLTNIQFVALRLYDPSLDGEFYIEDFVRGGRSGHAMNVTTVTPEPASLLLLFTGLLGVAIVATRARSVLKRPGNLRAQARR